LRILAVVPVVSLLLLRFAIRGRLSGDLRRRHIIGIRIGIGIGIRIVIGIWIDIRIRPPPTRISIVPRTPPITAGIIPIPPPAVPTGIIPRTGTVVITP
jgi:hypothetical protein